MATQIQAAVSSALQTLNLEPQDSGGMMGGPQELKITKETIERVTSLEGQIVVVEPSGDLSVPN